MKYLQKLHKTFTISTAVLSIIILTIYSYGNLISLPGNSSSTLEKLSTSLFLITFPICLVVSLKEINWKAPFTLIYLTQAIVGLIVSTYFLTQAYIGTIRSGAFFIWSPIFLILSLLILTTINKNSR